MVTSAYTKENQKTKAMKRRVRCEMSQREIPCGERILSGSSRRPTLSGPNPARWFRYRHKWRGSESVLPVQLSVYGPALEIRNKRGGTAMKWMIVPFCTERFVWKGIFCCGMGSYFWEEPILCCFLRNLHNNRSAGWTVTKIQLFETAVRNSFLSSPCNMKIC